MNLREKTKRARASNGFAFFIFFLCSCFSVFSQSLFTCTDRIYFFRNDSTLANPNGTLSYIENYQTGPLRLVDQCPMPTYSHNSMGINPLDGFMYYTDGYVINRLDANCRNTPLCGLDFVSYCGSFDWKGNYWVSDQFNQVVYMYDIKNCRILKGPFPLPETVADLVYNLFDCHLYIVGINAIYKMDTIGNIVSTRYYGSSGNLLGTPGGVTFGVDNKMYALQGFADPYNSVNNGGFFYRIEEKESNAQLLKSWINNSGPTLDNRVDLATVPCFQRKINPSITVNKDKGCRPLRVNFKGSASGVPLPNFWKFEYGDGTLADTAQETTHVFWQPGEYKVKMTAGVVSECGPVYYDSSFVIITVEDKPAVFADADVKSICQGSAVRLKAYGAGHILWNTGETSNERTVYPTATTTYKVIGFTSDGACEDHDSVVVQVDPKPTLFASSASYCEGTIQPTNLTVFGAKYYKWSDGFIGNSRGVNPSNTTKYRVTGYNSEGCYDTTSSIVTVLKNPAPELIANKTKYCLGDSLILKAKGGDLFDWYTPNNFSFKYGTDQLIVFPLTYNDSGTYMLRTYTNNYVCTRQTTHRIVISDKITLELPSHEIEVCEEKKVDIEVKSVNNTTSLLWKGPNGFSSTANQILIPKATLSDSGRYVVEGKLDGCAVKDSIHVKVWQKPDSIIGISKDSFCEGEAIKFGLKSGSSYNWHGPNGFVSSSDSVFFNPSTLNMAGLYDVKITNSKGCISGNQISIVVKPSPSILLGTSQVIVCEGTEIHLKALVVPVSASISWSGPNAFSSSLAEIDLGKATDHMTGTYLISSMLGDCEVKDSVKIIVDVLPDSIIYAVDNKDTICESGQGHIELALATHQQSNHLTWYQEFSSDPISFATSLLLDKPRQSGTYYAVVESPNNVCPPQETNRLPVKIYQLPHAIFSPNELTVDYAPNLQIPIPLVSIGAGMDDVTFLGWSPSTWLKKEDTLYPTIIPYPQQKKIEYILTLKTGKDGAECIASYVFQFFNRYPVVVPNAFSPNADNLNDVWIVEGLDWYPLSRLYVYNRWGNKVFENESGYKNPWDGMYHGKEMASGTYYYVLELRGSQDHTDHNLTGSVTIVR